MHTQQSFQKNYDGFRLRLAESGDIPVAISIIRDVFIEYGWEFRSEDEVPDFLNFDEYYNGNRFSPSTPRLFVVEWAGGDRVVTPGLVGCIALKYNEEGPYLGRVYLRKQVRGKGAGKWMTRCILGVLRDEGQHRVHLWTDTRFEPAHGLYQSLGFRFSGCVRSLHDVNKSFEYEMVLDDISGAD